MLFKNFPHSFYILSLIMLLGSPNLSYTSEEKIEEKPSIMAVLPVHAIQHILELSEPQDILNFGQTSKAARELLQDEVIWKSQWIKISKGSVDTGGKKNSDGTYFQKLVDHYKRRARIKGRYFSSGYACVQMRALGASCSSYSYLNPYQLYFAPI